MIQKIRDNNFRIILLTRDYGKISCWHKAKNCGYDTGDIIQTGIERVGTVNNIKTIERVMSASGRAWKYDGIIGFLEFVSLLGKTLPDSMPHPGIFDDYSTLLGIMQGGRNPEKYHFLLLKIRLLKILGILDSRDIENSPLLKYIYNNIRIVSISMILDSKEIDELTLQRIQKAIDISTNTLN